MFYVPVKNNGTSLKKKDWVWKIFAHAYLVQNGRLSYALEGC